MKLEIRFRTKDSKDQESLDGTNAFSKEMSLQVEIVILAPSLTTSYIYLEAKEMMKKFLMISTLWNY